MGDDETMPISEVIQQILECTTKIQSGKIDNTNFSIKINPRASVMPFLREVSAVQKQKFLDDEAYFCRKDLLGDVSRLLYPSNDYDKIIKVLKELLVDEDIGALLVASRICYEEDNGADEDKLRKSKLRSIFGPRGINLYNWLRSGDVFQEDVLPLLSCRDQFTSENDFKNFFKNHIEGLHDFHPGRIFVSTTMSRDDFISEINRRVCFYDAEKIVIYSRGGRNKLAGSVLNRSVLYFSNRKYFMKSESYSLGASNAIKFELTRVEHHRNMLSKNPKTFGEKTRDNVLTLKQKEKEKKRMNDILSLFKK